MLAPAQHVPGEKSAAGLSRDYQSSPPEKKKLSSAALDVNPRSPNVGKTTAKVLEIP
jgi:hypothetical protein